MDFKFEATTSESTLVSFHGCWNCFKEDGWSLYGEKYKIIFKIGKYELRKFVKKLYKCSHCGLIQN